MYFLIIGFLVILANFSLIFFKNVFLAGFLILLAGGIFFKEAQKWKMKQKSVLHAHGREVREKNKGTTRVLFQVSCQPEERERIKELAEKAGKTTSKFLVDLALGRN